MDSRLFENELRQPSSLAESDKSDTRAFKHSKKVRFLTMGCKFPMAENLEVFTDTI
jgi:hypothetical protein